MSPSLSVIIPAYNEAARLKKTLLTVFDYLDTVNENVFHARRVLLRLFERRVIGNGRRIKHDHVGEHSFFQKSAMIEPEIGCG